MKGTETRLEGFIEEVRLEMGVELGGDQAFQGFGQKGEVGYGTVVGKVGWVEGGFFEDGGHRGKFEGRGNLAEG